MRYGRDMPIRKSKLFAESRNFKPLILPPSSTEQAVDPKPS